MTLSIRKWIDVNTERFRKDCFILSEAMIRLLRHDQSVLREGDGAVRFDDIMEEFKKKFDGALQWSIIDWISILANGGGPKKRFQYWLKLVSSKHFVFFKANKGHSGSNILDLELQNNVLLPEVLTEYITHIGN